MAEFGTSGSGVKPGSSPGLGFVVRLIEEVALSDSAEVTRLLSRWADGELRRLAGGPTNSDGPTVWAPPR